MTDMSDQDIFICGSGDMCAIERLTMQSSGSNPG